MKRAIYPGTFDPVTFGHLDIIRRSSVLVDELDVVIMVNPEKHTIFSTEERLEMLRLVTQDIPNVKISAQKGLTVDHARKIGANVLIRGIRAVMDYEYELQQATANMVLAPEVETVFLLTRPKYSFLSSSVVKQIALNKGDLRLFVPEIIIPIILKKFD